jgi:hypothetical protein
MHGNTMNTISYQSAFRSILGALATTGLLLSCATPQTDTSQGTAPKAPVAAPAPAPAPAPPPAPELTPAQAKAQAQRLALEAVDQLQNGDETTARSPGQAVALDPTNDLAKKLQEQIKADAQRNWARLLPLHGAKRRFAVKLAQQYLGDRFRFYILAKYNDAASPNKLAAGQVIKIPDAPGDTARRGRAGAAEAVAAPAAADAAARRRRRTAAKGKDLEAKGNLEGAYRGLRRRREEDARQRQAVRRRDASRTACCSLDREGTQAFQRQNLDLAIAKWDAFSKSIPTTRRPSSSASAAWSSRRRWPTSSAVRRRARRRNSGRYFAGGRPFSFSWAARASRSRVEAFRFCGS